MKTFVVRCPRCSNQTELKHTTYLCSQCKIPQEVVPNLGGLNGLEFKNNLTANSDMTIWRYLPLLPIKNNPKNKRPVERSPLIKIEVENRQIFLKDETRLPSYSLKDRASSLVSAFAVENNINKIVCASTGNAAVSIALSANDLALSVYIIIPKSVSLVKLGLMKAFGAHPILIDGTYDDAFELSIEISNSLGFLNRNTAYNPITREGKKTVAFEICEQLNWEAPDWIVIPVGDGNIISGVAKGFNEFYQLGIIKKIPRLIAVQSEGSNVISRALTDFKLNRFNTQICRANSQSAANSICVDLPRDALMALAAIEESDGICYEFSDKELQDSLATLIAKTGIFCELSSAGAYLGALRAIREGYIKPQENIVCLITGSGFKEKLEVEYLIKLATETPMHANEFSTIEQLIAGGLD